MAKGLTVLPSGALLPHMSARRRNEVVDTVFEMVGGVERMAHEVNRNPETYMDFITKVWAKGLPRVSSAEHTLGGGVEDLLDRLDEEDRKGREQEIALVERDGVFVADDEAQADT